MPPFIYEKSVKALRSLELEFGIFDFCLEQDKWYFLEVNPFGNFLNMHADADGAASELGTDVIREALICSR